MSTQPLQIPAVFYGDGDVVQKRIRKVAKALMRGQPIEQALDLTPSELSSDPSIYLDLSNPSDQGNAFHLGYLAVCASLALPDQPGKHFSSLEAQEESIYDELLKFPAAVVSFMPRNSSLWIIEGSVWEGKLSKSRVDKLITALRQTTPWLKQVGKRFVGGISSDPQEAFAIHSIVTFLAVRNGLSQPTSWEEWDTTLGNLLRVEDWRGKAQF